jgi:hypothetical protein
MKKLALLVLFVLCLFSVLVSNQNVAVAHTQPALAEFAPASNPVYTSDYLSHTTCPQKRLIPRFINEQQVEAQGFHFQVTPPGGSYAFNQAGHQRYLSLRMDPFPFNGELSASRITEIDTSLPPEERVFCWQPTQTKNVSVLYTHRFLEAAPPPGLIENLFLWNAPLDTGGVITAVGVTRNNLLGGYFAIVAQDYDFATNTGLLQLVPMPAWLDATAWHTVNVTISQETATIKVKQGGNEATVLQTALLHPPDPLGFEFSLDNEIFPGVIVPVTIADQIDVAFYVAGLQPK